MNTTNLKQKKPDLKVVAFNFSKTSHVDAIQKNIEEGWRMVKILPPKELQDNHFMALLEKHKVDDEDTNSQEDEAPDGYRGKRPEKCFIPPFAKIKIQN